MIITINQITKKSFVQTVSFIGVYAVETIMTCVSGSRSLAYNRLTWRDSSNQIAGPLSQNLIQYVWRVEGSGSVGLATRSQVLLLPWCGNHTLTTLTSADASYKGVYCNYLLDYIIFVLLSFH